jgi:hypothetical protein
MRHFIRAQDRAMGADDVPILDIHILRFGQAIGLFDRAMKVERDYLALEALFLAISAGMDTKPSELDAVIWHEMANSPLAVRELTQAAEPKVVPPRKPRRSARNENQLALVQPTPRRPPTSSIPVPKNVPVGPSGDTCSVPVAPNGQQFNPSASAAEANAPTTTPASRQIRLAGSSYFASVFPGSAAKANKAASPLGTMPSACALADRPGSRRNQFLRAHSSLRRSAPKLHCVHAGTPHESDELRRQRALPDIAAQSRERMKYDCLLGNRRTAGATISPAATLRNLGGSGAAGTPARR